MRVAAHVFAVALALGLLAGGANAKRKPAWTWAALHRPLHVPTLAPGSRCPVSAMRRVPLDERQGTNGLAGPGPAYPSLSAPGAVEFVYPPVHGLGFSRVIVFEGRIVAAPG